MLIQKSFHPIIVGNIKEINEIQFLLNHLPSSFQNLKHPSKLLMAKKSNILRVNLFEEHGENMLCTKIVMQK